MADKQWYVWLHRRDNIAGIEVDGVYYEDLGYYLIRGKHAMLYDDKALASMGWSPDNPHIRAATPDEVEHGAKPVWRHVLEDGGREPKGDPTIVDFVPDDGFDDGPGETVIIFTDGTRTKHGSREHTERVRG